MPVVRASPNVSAHGIQLKYVRLCLFPFILSLTLRLEGAPVLRPQDVISGIDKAQEYREQKLAGYTAVEHYTVQNSHFREAAELVANVRYHKKVGKQYQVLWRRGPGVLQRRVIDRILKEDAVLSRPSERPHTLLTSANYAMEVRGTQLLRGNLCYVVNIRPRVHSFSLIEGTAWVQVDDFSVLRIEGKPAASPSFWIGRPFIERDYTIVEGWSFPQRSRATSHGLFAGKSQLVIDYSQYVLSKRVVTKSDAFSQSDKGLNAGITGVRQ